MYQRGGATIRAEADIVEPIDLGFLKQVEVASLLHTDDHPDVKRVEKMPFTSIAVNKGFTAKRHRDTSNEIPDIIIDSEDSQRSNGRLSSSRRSNSKNNKYQQQPRTQQQHQMPERV